MSYFASLPLRISTLCSTPFCLQALGLGVALSLLGGCQSASKAPAADPKPAVRTLSQEDALADFDAMWQIINDTHFDTTFNGTDWNAVRDEFRPKAQEAQNRRQIRTVMSQALDQLGQSHFGILPQADDSPAPSSSDSDSVGSKTDAVIPDQSSADEAGDADTGIDVRLIDGRAVVFSVRDQSPAQLAGVQTGWIISHIQGKGIDKGLTKLIESVGELEAGIHGVARVKSQLQGPPGSSVDLTFLDQNDQPIEMSITRKMMPGEFVKFGNLPPMSTHLEHDRLIINPDSANPTSIGVIGFNIWMVPIAPKFEKAMFALRDTDGLIIDLRGNPGGIGVLSSSISRFLLSEKGSLGTMTMRGTELSFNVEPVIVTSWGDRIEPYSGPIAVLTDSGSASTSEVFAGGLQSLGRIKVFGTRTAGMALPAGMVKLPSGDVLLHAIADFVTSTGERLEHSGVIPDFKVPLTREDLLNGIDSPKQAAIDWINESITQ